MQPYQINYIFGGNGSGKTTISSFLADTNNYCNGKIEKDDGSEVLVYNKAFVDKNFQDKNAIKGIFTIGESAVEATKFIEALNKFINFQILFRLHFNYEIKYVISLKVFQEEKIKVLKTFESEWQEPFKQELPLTTKLENVYKLIVKNVAGYAFCQNETFEQYADRMTAIKKQKADIGKLIKMRDAERQPNKKIELNDKVRQMKKDLQRLESQLFGNSE